MIKQGNSDTYPEIIVISNDFFQCRYNITEAVKEEIDGETHRSYNYDYIEVKELTEASILDALVENGCSDDLEVVAQSFMEFDVPAV